MSRKKALLSIVILLLVVPAVVLLKPGAPKLPAGAEENSTAEEGAVTRRAKVIHRSIIGSLGWHDPDAEILNKQLSGFFERAEVKLLNDVIAMILPHAGYRFSGQTAVRAIKTTDKKYSRIVVIGPSHRTYMEEMLSVPTATHYETPLGETPLDVDFIEKLLEYPMFHSVPHAHKEEHSVQIELPLLQYKQKDFKFVPIVAGHCSPSTINRVGSILRSLVDEHTFVIASSDFVHYGRTFG
ncbi:MAG: AmmeMemoRadiSam system protein B, partial [Planctomycetota bacterium]